MKKTFYPFLALAVGLLVAQAAASGLVFLSNRELWAKTQELAGAGYLAIPNELVRPLLLRAGAAARGAVFLTLSLGAGLSFLALVAAWAWDRLFSRNRAVLIGLAAAWASLPIGANLRGFEPVGTVLGLVVPPAVFFTAKVLMPRRERAGPVPAAAAFLVPLAVLALAWLSLAGKDVFLDIRDFVLWSSRPGRAVSDFYYHNTLYPAEMIKSLSQKTGRTCRTPSGGLDPRAESRLKNLLFHFDYLPLANPGPVDLELLFEQGSLVFRRQGREVMRAPWNAFTADPARHFKMFSEKTDNRFILRRAILYSLMFPAPAALYLLFFSFLRGLAGMGLSPAGARLAAGAACLALGLLFLAPVASGRATRTESLDRLLASGKWTDRVAGLRRVARENLEIENFPGYRKIMAGPGLPERYWLAAALGRSKALSTRSDLLRMLGDPQPNVVCQALDGLSRRRDPGAREIILEKLRTSDHWYVQWYAYQALGSMGWTQKPSS
ncbi:MAG: HEAT repeat domain-containing protein [Pseudomonadota bacterium]